MAMPAFDAQATELLKAKAQEPDSGTAASARWLLHAHAAKPAAHPAAEEQESEATEAFAAKLADPSPSVRKYALQALVSVVGPGDIGLVGPLVENLPVMDRASRRTILDLLAAIGDVEAIPQILSAGARLSPRELRAAEAMLVGFGEAAIPRLMQGLRNAQTPYRARAVAARALSTLSPAQFLSQLDRLVAEELGETGPRLAVAERFEAEAHRSAAMSLLAHAYRQRIAEAVDFTLELLALGGLLPDFDLLIVSLHSANPKVRGNAIEAIAAGVDHATWKRLDPLVNRRAVAERDAGGDLVPLLKAAVETAHGFEAAAAAQALRDLVPTAELAACIRGALDPGAPAIFRDSYASLLGVDGGGRPTVVDLVAAIRQRPEFAPASIDAQVALAERATREPAARKPVALEVDGATWWLSRPDVDEVAARYPDLALTLLKAQDTRAYAA
jgi:hypothetical protein